MIDRATIDRIFDAARIVDVVEEFVSLKRKGANYFGCCPFHNERTPSFSVNPARNIYKCFGCGKAGNAVNFIMEHEHLSYVDALHYLAKKYHIEIVEKEQTEDEKRQKDKRESLIIVSEYAARIFQDNLFNSREGSLIGLSYFKERGFREETIKKFELGYCFEAREAFTKKALEEGYKEEYLVETGLLIKNERGLFDRFAGRVMFPIHSLAGKVIAFGGRILKTDQKTAKYLNSPESEIYHKSKVLYGIYQARKSMVQNDKCFLVEGYTDVISMHQAGIENVVASSGTSLTVEQIQLIKRFTPNITVLYDGDSAGIKASLRGIDMILQEDMNVKVLLLPDGEDPDSFARTHSVTELEDFIRTNETDFITFKAKLLLDDAKGDPIKRAQMIKEVVESIALIPQDITRSVYLRECSRLFEIDERVLAENVNTIRRKTAVKSKQKPRYDDVVEDTVDPFILREPEQPISPKNLDIFEQEIIRLMISYGNSILIEPDIEAGTPGTTVSEYFIHEFRVDDLSIQQPLLQKIFNEYEQLLATGESVNDTYFTRHSDPEISKTAAGLIAPKYVLSRIHTQHGAVVKTEEVNLNAVVPQSLMAYRNYRVILMLEEIGQAIRQAEEDKNTVLLDELFARYISLNQVKKELAQFLGKRVYNF